MSITHRPSLFRPSRLLGVVAALAFASALTGFVLRPGAQLSPRFNHVMLYVSDLDASIDFYTRAFDLEVTQRLDALTVVAADGSETVQPVKMAFLKFPGQDFVFELSEQVMEVGGLSPFYQHVGIDVLDIGAAADRVLAAGARDFSGIRTVRGTGGVEARNAFFRGPDGEMVELMQMVSGAF